MEALEEGLKSVLLCSHTAHTNKPTGWDLGSRVQKDPNYMMIRDQSHSLPTAHTNGPIGWDLGRRVQKDPNYMMMREGGKEGRREGEALEDNGVLEILKGKLRLQKRTSQFQYRTSIILQ